MPYHNCWRVVSEDRDKIENQISEKIFRCAGSIYFQHSNDAAVQDLTRLNDRIGPFWPFNAEIDQQMLDTPKILTLKWELNRWKMSKKTIYYFRTLIATE